MTRNRFDKQIHLLNEDLIYMGKLVNDRIDNSVQALLNNDLKLANYIINNDDDIDEYEKLIEDRALKLILRQQPVAKDLRFISSALKMITDLERIGDHAVDIAELTTRIIDLQGRELKRDIIEMAKLSMSMVNESIKSFTQNNLTYIENIGDYEDEVDEYFNKVKNQIINDIKNDIGNPEVSIDFLMIAKYLERVGDHAENISEWVFYSILGKDRSD